MSISQTARNALNSTLVTSQRTTITPEIWKSYLTTGLRKLVIKEGLADYAFACDIIKRTDINTNSLETLDISGPATQELSLLIAELPVTKLALEPSNLYTDKYVLSMVRNLNLVEVDIRCTAVPCIFRRQNREEQDTCEFRKALWYTCQNLSRISMACRCWTSYDVGQEMLGIITAIRKPLEIHVSTSAFALDGMFARLPKVSRIEFTMVGDRAETTRTMPSRWVFTRGVDIRRVQYFDMMALRSLSDLREVKLEVMDRAEIGLHAIPLAQVRTLHIGGSQFATKPRGHLYYTLEREAVFRTVLTAPLLSDVSIVTCKIDRDELHAVIRYLGCRLKRFQASMFGQSECPSQRVLDLVSTMAEFSSGVETFVFKDQVRSDLVEKLLFGTETYDRYLSLYIRLFQARALLIERAPFLDPGPLTNVVKSLYPRYPSLSCAQ